MITSIAGFVIFPESENNVNEIKKFRGFDFVNINNKWVAAVNNNQVVISFDPELVGEQNIIPIGELNSGEKIYFSSDQNATNYQIYQEINSLAPLLKPKTVNSCLEDSEICAKLPLKTCNDAKDLNKVIVIKEQNITSINYKNNCLELIGTETDIIKFIDQLILSLI